jgi:uncharacterized protein (TIGR02611 family)
MPRRLESILKRHNAGPVRLFLIRLVIGVVGTLVVLVGLVLVPLPGPGWLIVIFGLGILAIEFLWARRLMHFTRRQVFRWTAWVGRQQWPLRITVGLLLTLFVAVVAWASIRLSTGVDAVVWLQERMG